MLWCFLGIFGDRKRQNLNIFLKVGAGCGSACLLFDVSAGADVCRRSGLSSLSGVVRSSGGVFPAFLPALLLYACLVACKYGSIWLFKAFLAGFMALVWVYVVLVLCVACVAFVRVWS